MYIDARHLIVALGMLALTACPRGTGAPAPSPTAPTKPPPVEVIAQNITLPASGVVRFGIRPADPTLRIIVSFPDTGSIVAACGLGAITDPVPTTPTGSACKEELPSGVREEISRPRGLGAVAIWLRSGRAVDANIRLEYAEAARDLVLRIPVVKLPPSTGGCRDNECNPFVEVRPVRKGRFIATARWSGGNARFVLLQGTVLAKSFTATGVPYGRASERTGRPPLALDTLLSAPAEYALALDRNTTDLSEIEIVARWP